ncbi:diphthamide biosynthesis protein [Conidiobolus coronatus NRRL 28638]|uniref:2-(3-amino-3-carboxypropyl)histidine synthase subunit 2 n=1 Tax=Conidiobolus coronatus (strain ATCC 28846 / CBS 209.66 / NRRL 28638) TaxID=796925 RepID=A0A137PDB6_CONC2|nr:diphthamide biosynthesis protein [Conidiobolus coronatus NRRL 28638]|eukprot:KXN72998.1 diphthamide biosynthesis protein [Conidiobolus coronatus NRRL 28638]
MTESTSLSNPVPIADDGSTAIQRTVEVQDTVYTQLTDEEVFNLFEIEKTCRIILEKGFEQIALQFPDELLPISNYISQQLAILTRKPNFILADTSYGSCCVDEVAVSHVESGVIIHYGHSCLTRVDKYPVIYVYGKNSLNLDDCIEKSKAKITSHDGEFKHIIVTGELDYSDNFELISNRLQSEFPDKQLIFTIAPETQHIYDDSRDRNYLEAKLNHSKFGERYMIKSKDELDQGVTIDDFSEALVIYIGGESLGLSQLIITNSSVPIYAYNPSTEKFSTAKDSSVFGILVGTLGVGSFLPMIDHLKQLIKSKGQKYYTFVMGKLNVAKLANFMEIDVFILVACPENSLIDSKDFYKPVITPYELQLALDDNLGWSGKLVTDFETIIKESSNADNDESNSNKDSDDEDAPHFSLITGKFVKRRNYQPDSQETSDQLNALTINSHTKDIAVAFGSASGEHLHSREYIGLNPEIGQTEVKKAEEGRRGVARGYTHETN